MQFNEEANTEIFSNFGSDSNHSLQIITDEETDSKDTITKNEDENTFGLDIYADFLSQKETENSKAQEEILKENLLLNETNKCMKDQLEKTVSENEKLSKENVLLQKNISLLYKTAKLEMDRKTKEIADLRKRLDDMIFRRDRKNNRAMNMFQNRKFESNTQQDLLNSEPSSTRKYLQNEEKHRTCHLNVCDESYDANAHEEPKSRNLKSSTCKVNKHQSKVEVSKATKSSNMRFLTDESNTLENKHKSEKFTSETFEKDTTLSGKYDVFETNNNCEISSKISPNNKKFKTSDNLKRNNVIGSKSNRKINDLNESLTNISGERKVKEQNKKCKDDVKPIEKSKSSNKTKFKVKELRSDVDRCDMEKRVITKSKDNVNVEKSDRNRVDSHSSNLHDRKQSDNDERINIKSSPCRSNNEEKPDNHNSNSMRPKEVANENSRSSHNRRKSSFDQRKIKNFSKLDRDKVINQFDLKSHGSNCSSKGARSENIESKDINSEQTNKHTDKRCDKNQNSNLKSGNLSEKNLSKKEAHRDRNSNHVRASRNQNESTPKTLTTRLSDDDHSFNDKTSKCNNSDLEEGEIAENSSVTSEKCRDVRKNCANSVEKDYVNNMRDYRTLRQSPQSKRRHRDDNRNITPSSKRIKRDDDRPHHKSNRRTHER